MSDPHTTAPTPPSAAPAPATPRGVKIALALSVALNLGVAGLAVGAWLGDGPHRGMPRDMSFGPFTEALDEDDRRAIRKALLERLGEFREQRAAARAEFETLLATLRADPFDPEALKAALEALEARNAQRLDLGRSLIETRLIEMSPSERAAFADRLEKGLRRGGKD
ncbi:periplasmic heavy metal sensor [Tabrizicola sp.]|uniref:periplasmic heavy metal sensor n=1 Tax=Tabrizicola sp. TaxID=2005166 RepID=UPI001A415BF3|nr:periplasmic heavy metal sensor [Tabrizicola sp.]MBL9074109.1 periplasmic heavy metal sensor [Tabrizicola sp.]